MSAAGASGLYVNPNTGAAQVGLAQFRNAIINGDMRINQRGTSTNLASMTAVATASPGSWAVDRWNVYKFGYQSGAVMGQGLNLSINDLPFIDSGITTFSRLGRSIGVVDGISALLLTYNIESQDSIKYAGKTITLSFYYRTGSGFGAAALSADIITGTGNDQAIRNGYTGQTTSKRLDVSPSSIWKRAISTTLISSSATQIGISISAFVSGTAVANDYFDITGVQLELGSVATPFEVRPYPVELELCKRYYQRFTVTCGGGPTPTAADRQYFHTINFPVTLRAWATPSLLNTYVSVNAKLTDTLANYDEKFIIFRVFNTTANDLDYRAEYAINAEM